MYVPLADPSSEAVANAVKANLHDFFRHLGHVTGTASGDSGLERWHTQVPFPWFNGVLASRPAIDGDENLVREAVPGFVVMPASFIGADGAPVVNSPNFRAMSITVPDQNAVGGTILAGDIVDMV